MAPPLLLLQDIHLTFGGTPLLEGAALSVSERERLCLVGRNGSGKSTLLKIAAGSVKADDGRRFVQPGVTVRYLPQEPDLSAFDSVLDYVQSGLAPGEDPYAARVMLEGLGLTGEESPKHMSGGELRRAALSWALAPEPDILLLDEPTNHLDAESVQWLEATLRDYKGCVILVTHDRYFLDNVTSWILELDRGKGIPHEGNYSSFLEIQEKRLKQESNEEAAQQRTIAREREWIKQSPKARQAKSKARINSYEELVKKSQEQRQGAATIMIPVAERLGDLVIDAENLAKGYGDRLLYENVNFKLPAGGIVGVIGPNGAGKTTLFRMLTGQEKPDAGTLKVGPTVHMGYVDQSRDTLDPNKTVYQEISGGTDFIEFGKTKINARAYCGHFAFKGGDQQKKVGQLSGGERNRVHLAKMLRSGANLLLLDEPTNDLDVETLRALESALEEFAGCAMIISHDRWFLDRIATHMLAFEGDSHVEWFEGNYQDYEADKKRRLGVDADTPHRIKYKRFARA
ncbi:MAG TPA: energy-dependent translational throttle protein EttA [Rhizomicrobium sp.]|nr:energy-dependent translational throttle protein EttA [Rhizomicrobium sp.]